LDEKQDKWQKLSHILINFAGYYSPNWAFIMRKPPHSSSGKNTSGRRSSETRGNDRPKSFSSSGRSQDRSFKPAGPKSEKPSGNRFGKPATPERPARFKGEGAPSERAPFSRPRTASSAGDRPRSNRPNASERPSRPRPEEKSFRPDSRPSRFKSDDRSSRFKSDDRPAPYRSDDRSSRFKSDDRPAPFRSDDRPARFKSDDRPAPYRSDDRPSRFKSDDRPSRPQSNDRPERSQEAPGRSMGGFGKRTPNVRSQENINLDHSRRVDTGGKETYEEERMKKALPPRVQAKLPENDQELIRLNRYISNAGLCSRREADELISSGQIRVNGKVVDELGYKVQPSDNVTYGRKVLNKEKLVYLLLNKPKDYLTTTEDPEERKTVMDLVGKACKERIYPVGRLDRNTTGLLLLTNDGELAEKLSHPSSNMKKVYQAELDKPITLEHFEQIKAGLELEDGFIKPDDLGIVTPDAEVVGIEIHSGKNRIVRRIFEHLGYDVLKLDRTIYAGLTKKDLPRGMWRFLTEKEVIRLKYMM